MEDNWVEVPNLPENVILYEENMIIYEDNVLNDEIFNEILDETEWD